MNTIRLLLLWLAGLSAAIAEEPALIVGAVISQTGAHADLAAEYAKGIELWRDEVNASGGLLGRQVELRLLDDASHAARAAPLYARLIREENADLLISPYGSAATLLAAAEAERARRVMVNAAGQAPSIHGRAPGYLFQSTPPYSSYGEGILQVAAEAGYRRLFILARDDGASLEMAEATLSAARTQKKFEPGGVEVYRPGTVDFGPQVAKARAAQAEAWIAFGDARDAAEMVKTFKRFNYAPQLFFARGASQPRFIELVGQDAEFALGAVDFDPRIGEGAHAFARAFAAKWGATPGLPAAQGYTAGVVLTAAVRNAGSLDQEKLRSALALAEVPTPLGPYKVSAKNGAQVGAKPLVVQIRKGRPEAENPLLPYPQWNERAPIQ
ncbi:MAG TPA: ABC transporter substrate-binding protein [Burkholderiales bacterium]|nr:ABC transporter substrate-binding protein [Burkholderiales bacterium]